jgi:hypothetical protein
MTKQPDPTKVKVQLNVPITWEWMAHLDEISAERRTAKAQLVREAIEKAYPLPVDRVRQETRDAGATR